MRSAWRAARRAAVLERLREENCELRRVMRLEAHVVLLETENAKLRAELRRAHDWSQQLEHELATVLAGKLALEGLVRGGSA